MGNTRATLLKLFPCSFVYVALPSAAFSSLGLYLLRLSTKTKYHYAVPCATLGSLPQCMMIRFSEIPLQIYATADPLACGCRYEWRQPVKAYRLSDVLTAINTVSNC